MLLCMGVRNNCMFLPYWPQNDLIEEIVVKVFGSCETHPFNGERCHKAKENACATKYAKSGHIVGLQSHQQEAHRGLATENQTLKSHKSLAS